MTQVPQILSSPSPQNPLARQASASWYTRVRQSRSLLPLVVMFGLSTVALATVLVTEHVEGRALPSLNTEAPAAEQTSQPAPPAPQPLVTAPVPPGAGPMANRVAPASTADQPAPGLAGAASAAGPSSGALCAHCGTVEQVTAVTKAQPTSGAGAVAGGVLGGLLGNQFGHGTGRAAMTVLGAVGGGYAGNSVERHLKQVTVYQVRVRLQNGKVRTLEMGTPVAVGTQVRVEGHGLRVVGPAAGVAAS